VTSATSLDRLVREPRRLGPRGRRVFDVALVGVLLLGCVYALDVTGSGVYTALSVVQIVPLLWRRRHPVAVLVVVAGLCLVQVALTDVVVWGQLAVPVVLYSVARFSRPAPAALGLVVGLAGAATAAWDWRIRGFGNTAGETVSDVTSTGIALAAIVVASWSLGTLGRIRRSYVDALVERADRIEREATQRIALAASDERARIAREMHDVVAHALSVVVVQADGARYAAAHDPAVAPAALERIAGTGRTALTDMRQLLGLLRSDETGTKPLPGLADVPDLVDEAGATVELHGLDVDGRVEGPVSGAVGLTAYRVVQEALTNVRKHAGPGARAEVSVRVGEGAVEVRVRDDGRGAGADGPDPDSPGHGLVGMRERVALHGGTLRAGPRDGGGFEVTALLPR